MAAFLLFGSKGERPLLFLTMAVMGTEHTVRNGRFQETEFHWPLSGNEFEERTVASVP